MGREKTPLDYYEDIPREMRSYLRNYGYSFSKRACEYAVSRMRKADPVTGKSAKIEPFSKEKVEEMLKKHGVTLKNNIGYNHVYVANMIAADYWKSSVEDEEHLCRMVKDIIDDVDDNPENVFRRWIISMDGNGEPIEWEDLL